MTISGYDLSSLEAYRYQDGGYYYEKNRTEQEGEIDPGQ